MIDLGLPSGTKWACCNVGATTPEANGNYYAWGETQPKGNYSDRTYQYYQDKTWVNIGSDIAGTYYDAATASWGAPWRMPTEDQCEELKNECSIVWTTYNGVYGRMFIGPNDSTVFLPAVGGYRGALFAGTENGTTATLTASDDAAGIGGGENENTGSINIHGGKITAMGGYAPGIGGGYCTDYNNKTYGGTIVIYGGEINATAGSQSAGIGSASGNAGGSVTIYGGTINASSLQIGRAHV